VIFGYACAADISARDLADRDGQWARAKGFDTFCPLGPWIETDAAPGDLALTASVNGEVRQRGQLRGGVPDLVAYASSVMTLLPGDVLLTGPLAGTGRGRAGRRAIGDDRRNRHPDEQGGER
jgi:2-keto-4-pentenoate hydratase/2-oxohepta-3-ene-1,7-dioic acid hydratase in catechol pathway